MTRDKTTFDRAKEVLGKHFNYPTFEVKESTAFIKMVEKKRSIKALMEGNFLFGYHYKKPLEQIEDIARHILKD